MASSAHAIVIGNEKGGTGKSTTAMHIIVSLLHRGCRVGSVDLDARQGTLTRYVENRRATATRKGIALAWPAHQTVAASGDAEKDAQAFFSALQQLAPFNDFVVIDCPGHDNPLSRLGHNFADTLITPLNDSFIDLDNLADVEPESFDIRRPSRYAEMVWEEKKRRMLRDRGSIDWVVLRNRLSHLDARNKRRVGDVLERLAERIGYRVVPGLTERVIYRELFLDGLTLLDVMADGSGVDVTMSHLAARQELRDLMDSLNLEMPASAEAVPA
ncbi:MULTISPECIES: division plane positioning ATPase MipZ [unclassified Minwuia]|jgi:chromosome partitioning protein|uniref:division plane positioning ATPase MipZ n=1 Tax=unclassified Minwuia TaxID=2618799 RepID=UPI0024796E46|nr:MULTISPECIES: division plane positioning ATPase MipZ [unclassified Minwuia]